MLREGYTGGAVDVFKPTTDSKVFGYDINSMYPFVMSTKLFPVGIPTYFEGFKDITKDNLFGFVKAKITAPLSLKYPLLQIRIANKTVSPVGS